MTQEEMIDKAFKISSDIAEMKIDQLKAEVARLKAEIRSAYILLKIYRNYDNNLPSFYIDSFNAWASANEEINK